MCIHISKVRITASPPTRGGTAPLPVLAGPLLTLHLLLSSGALEVNEYAQVMSAA